MTADNRLSGAACTTGAITSQLVQSTSENDKGPVSRPCPCGYLQFSMTTTISTSARAAPHGQNQTQAPTVIASNTAIRLYQSASRQPHRNGNFFCASAAARTVEGDADALDQNSAVGSPRNRRCAALPRGVEPLIDAAVVIFVKSN